jgi:hypothetical protein
MHPLASRLEIIFDKYQKKITTKTSFEDYVCTLINREHKSGRKDIAKELSLELSFKPKDIGWSDYFNRNEAGERDVYSFDEYLYFLRKNGTYLGEQELVAFADLVNKPLHVYNPNRIEVNADGNPVINERCLPKLYDICIINPATSSTEAPIYLYHVNGNHYELLTLKR